MLMLVGLDFALVTTRSVTKTLSNGMTTTLFSSVECSQRLNVPLHRISYAQRIGRLPKPGRLVAGKAIYTQADLRMMATYFGVELQRTGVGDGKR